MYVTKNYKNSLNNSLVSAFCRLRFLQQMMLPCWYTLQLNSNRANYHFTLLATNFNYVSFARISVLRKWQGPLIALNSLVQIKMSLVSIILEKRLLNQGMWKYDKHIKIHHIFCPRLWTIKCTFYRTTNLFLCFHLGI